MSDIIWSVNPAKDDTGDLFERIKKFAAEFLLNTPYVLNINIPDEIRDLPLRMEKRRNIYLILKECLHNSVKYAQGNNIEIKVSRKNRKVFISYSDDGIGFNQDQVNALNGNGLMNMRKRSEEINAELKINSMPGKGMSLELVVFV